MLRIVSLLVVIGLGSTVVGGIDQKLVSGSAPGYLALQQPPPPPPDKPKKPPKDPKNPDDPRDPKGPKGPKDPKGPKT